MCVSTDFIGTVQYEYRYSNIGLLECESMYIIIDLPESELQDLLEHVQVLGAVPFRTC